MTFAAGGLGKVNSHWNSATFRKIGQEEDAAHSVLEK